MADILAIVSKAIFERDAVVQGRLIQVGDVWAIDRYVSSHRTFDQLRQGGRIILVTVRPPDETLWFVGVIDSPLFEGNTWLAQAANSRPITNISSLRSTIMFTSGRGISQDSGALGMSLQTPRVLTDESAAEILALVGGARPAPRATGRSMMTAASSNATAFANPSDAPIVMAADAIEEDVVIRKGRVANLDKAVSRFVVLFDKMQETYGLRLPENIAYGVGFLVGLNAEERTEVEAATGKLVGVATWFDDVGLHTPAPSGDERLRDCLKTDVPEFVPVLASAERGLRWGLWYDDSDELPSGIVVQTRVSDEPGFETRHSYATFLQAIKSCFMGYVSRIQGATPSEARQHAAIVAWLNVVLRREAADVRERPPAPLENSRLVIAEHFKPHIDAPIPLDLVGSSGARRTAYLDPDGGSLIEEWINLAHAELRDGSPVRAFVLGRELHMFQAYTPKWYFARSELLIRAYAILGRRPLADILRATYRHEHPELPIYELPPAHPVVSAAEVDGDIEHALSEGDLPSSDDIEEAFATPTLTLSTLDALLSHARTRSLRTDAALWRRLIMLFRSRKPKDAAHHRKLAVHLLKQGNVNARAYERILRSGDAELIATASAHVEVDSVGSGGATPLHFAARAAAAAAVNVLLDRGADPRAKNADGRMAYDAAREALTENPNDKNASEILTKLQLVGGGMAKPPLPASEEIEYEEGDEVHHAKLGDGVVESVTGEGEEAKLKIRFEKETRTLLAKFVTPK